MAILLEQKARVIFVTASSEKHVRSSSRVGRNMRLFSLMEGTRSIRLLGNLSTKPRESTTHRIFVLKLRRRGDLQRSRAKRLRIELKLFVSGLLLPGAFYILA